MAKRLIVVLILCILIIAAALIYLQKKSSEKPGTEPVTEAPSVQTVETYETEDGENTKAVSETETTNEEAPEVPSETEAETLVEVDANSPYQPQTVEYSVDNGLPFLAAHIAEGDVLGSSSYPLLSPFGPRDNLGTAISTDHRGMDFAMPLYTRLLAPFDTVISYVGENGSRGNWLVMYMGNGLYLEYQHLSEVYVFQGDVVKAGMPIAESGNTGISIMDHLHLEILKSPTGEDDVYDFEDLSLRVDPALYLYRDYAEILN